MSALDSNQATQEPQSVAQAEAMIHQLKDEIGAIHNQLSDPHRRDSMEEGAYRVWHFSALKASRHKKATIRHLSQWLQRGRPLQGKITTAIEVGRILKFAAKQHGKLVRVFEAAEAYINSRDDAEDEIAFASLNMALDEARKFVILGNSSDTTQSETDFHS